MFCVVDPLFETTKNIPVIWVDYDEGYIYYTDKILIYGDWSFILHTNSQIIAQTIQEIRDQFLIPNKDNTLSVVTSTLDDQI